MLTDESSGLIPESKEQAMAFIDFSDIYGDSLSRGMAWYNNKQQAIINEYLARRSRELADAEQQERNSWNPDRQCMKCGDKLHWVRMAMVCKTHGYSGKGC